MSKIPTTNEMIETVNGLAIQNAIFIVFLFLWNLALTAVVWFIWMGHAISNN